MFSGSFISSNGGNSVPNPLQFKGSIAIASDFPTSVEVKTGWFYIVTANVTDNDATKTNTGQSFSNGDEIVWNGTNWSEIGSIDLWSRSGTDTILLNSGDNVGIGKTPTEKLDVLGIIKTSGSASRGILITDTVGDGTGYPQLTSYGGTLFLNSSTGYFQLQADMTPSSNNVFKLGSSTRVFKELYTNVITDDGNSLKVDGDIGINGLSSNITFYDNSQAKILSDNLINSKIIMYGRYSSQDIITFNDDGNVNIPNGNLLIGTTGTPLSKLHINGGTGTLSTGLTFGDGDTGFYESADDVLRISTNGNNNWAFENSKFRSARANYGAVIDSQASSSTLPVHIFENDLDTGIGRAGADQLSLIAGGSEVARLNTTNFQTQSAIIRNISKITSSTYTLLSTDDIISINYTSTGTNTLTLPTNQTVSGRTIVIKDGDGNAGTNNITIVTQGSETIDGLSTTVLNSDYQSITLFSDGSDWFII